MGNVIETAFRIIGDDHFPSVLATDVIIGQVLVLVDLHCLHALSVSKVVPSERFGSLSIPHGIVPDLRVVHVLIRFCAANSLQTGGANFSRPFQQLNIQTLLPLREGESRRVPHGSMGGIQGR